MAKRRYYQRPDGLFEASRTINGKRVMFRGKTCREVDKKILEYQEERELGRKFPVVADEWEREHEPEVSESTRRVYSYAVKRLKTAFPDSIGAIKPLDVKRYITALRVEQNTLRREADVCKGQEVQSAGSKPGIEK